MTKTKVPLIDILSLIEEVAKLDPEPQFVFQIYTYVKYAGPWRTVLEINEGESTYWCIDCGTAWMTANQWLDEPLTFTFVINERS